MRSMEMEYEDHEMTAIVRFVGLRKIIVWSNDQRGAWFEIFRCRALLLAQQVKDVRVQSFKGWP